MTKHHTSFGHSDKVVREALSVIINEPYESAMAGHIKWALSSEKKKIGGYKITDVYYIKRL
jgi:hypothetical protein